MLPTAFHTQMTHLLGLEEAEALCQAIQDKNTPTSVRLNVLKPSDKLGIDVESAVPWCKMGRYLTARPKFTYDPLLHAGCYYVQEAASMFIEQAYRVVSKDFVPVRLLDLCAAPGGKSTLWRSLLPEGSLLVANEPIRQRAQILNENMMKWGHPDTLCTSAYPDEFSSLVSFFDVIAADVPCSGEGMFRKDESAIAEWSPESVDTCAARQWDIIESIWPTLRKGGYLVYSTCTYNRQENEDNVVRICQELGAELVPIPIDEMWGISGDTTARSLPVYHFFAHKTRGEGLFLALLRKTAEAPIMKVKKNKKNRDQNKTLALRHAAQLADWLKDNETFKLYMPDDEHVAAIRQIFYDDALLISSQVKTLNAGIMLAELKAKKVIPQHALALSSALASDAFPIAELSLDESLSYLRRESLCLSPEVPRGYVLAVYQGHPLGFLNNLGARANNLYPQEWRIRN